MACIFLQRLQQSVMAEEKGCECSGEVAAHPSLELVRLGRLVRQPQIQSNRNQARSATLP